MENQVKAVEIYTESTPNPETLKFVSNQMLLQNGTVDYTNEEDAKGSPLAVELFGFPYIRGVFICSNFITITKHSDYEWYDITPSLKTFLKEYLLSDKVIIVSVPAEKTNSKPNEPTNSEDDEKIVVKIKELLETYIKPAVEMDGGAIYFKSYSAGKVNLTLQGACSGCPSSTLTLKAGIEGMMKKMIPEVTEVVAE